MRFLFTLLIIGAGSAAGLNSATFAACTFIWHNLFRPQEFAYRPDALPLPLFVLAVLGGSYLLNIFRGKLQPKWNGFLTLAFIFMGWLLISALVSNYDDALPGFQEILKYLLPIFLISTLLQTKNDVKYLAFAVMIAVGVWGAQAGVKGLIDGVTPKVGIPGGQMSDNNDFMVAVVSTLPLFVYFTFNYAGKFRIPARIAMGGMLFLSIAGVVFSNSRGATVGLGGTVAVYIMLISKKRIRDTVIIVMLVVIGWNFLPAEYFDRMSTIELGADQTEASAASRVELAKAAFRGTLANPVFGVGPHCWLAASLNYGDQNSEPHNVWLKCSVENGIPGLLFFLAIIGWTINAALRVRRRAKILGDTDAMNLSTALAMSVFGFLLPSTFVSHPFSEMLWTLFATTNAYSTRYFLNKPYTKPKIKRNQPLEEAEGKG